MLLFAGKIKEWGGHESEEATRASKLSELIVSQLPPIYNSTKLITLKTIPRNAAGKLIRVQLKEALRHFLPK